MTFEVLCFSFDVAYFIVKWDSDSFARQLIGVNFLEMI